MVEGGMAERRFDRLVAKIEIAAVSIRIPNCCYGYQKHRRVHDCALVKLVLITR